MLLPGMRRFAFVRKTLAGKRMVIFKSVKNEWSNFSKSFFSPRKMLDGLAINYSNK
jgi:hypothetical protein